jgi:sugar phosphate isomerase/epimerase
MSNEIGVLASLKYPEPSLAEVAAFGLKICQLCCWNQDKFTAESAAAIREEREETGVKINSLWAGWPGPKQWNFTEGPTTLGLVPEEYRAERVAALKKAADWAADVGLEAIVTHLGFIPENPSDPLWPGVVEAVKDVAEHAKARGIGFWFETGQETPVTMKRLIEVVGTGNLGVNLDTANLILYGKANPIDSLDVFGEYVFSTHAKDGLYPTDPMKLGTEVKVGEGKVRFPEFIARFKEIGCKAPLIIEREISGEQQKKDIADTVEYLRGLVG